MSLARRRKSEQSRFRGSRLGIYIPLALLAGVIICPLMSLMLSGPLPGGRLLFQGLYANAPSRSAFFRFYESQAHFWQVDRSRHNPYLVERATTAQDPEELEDILNFLLDQEWPARAAGTAGLAERGRLIDGLVALLNAADVSDDRVVNIVVLIEFIRQDGSLYKPVFITKIAGEEQRYWFGQPRRTGHAVQLGSPERQEIIRLISDWWAGGSQWPANKELDPFRNSPFAVEPVA